VFNIWNTAFSISYLNLKKNISGIEVIKINLTKCNKGLQDIYLKIKSYKFTLQFHN
jgi:hypothetical protein